jgi:putative DNA primase/helicase
MASIVQRSFNLLTALSTPDTDSMHLPSRNRFSSAANYYASLLHELSHRTGHQSRLNRDLAHPYGSQGYTREELRAEIASMIVGSELGIGYDPGQHAAYAAGWVSILKDQPLEIFRAAADAEKIQKYLYILQQKESLTDMIKEYDRVVDGPQSRKQLENENPGLVAERDAAIIRQKKEQVQRLIDQHQSQALGTGQRLQIRI